MAKEKKKKDAAKKGAKKIAKKVVKKKAKKKAAKVKFKHKKVRSIVVEGEEIFSPLAKPTDQQKVAALGLSAMEARHLVDQYYQIQKLRIGSGNQIQACATVDEGNAFIQYVRTWHEDAEGKLKEGLGLFAENRPLGKWLFSVRGVGPVLAAGLLAHVNPLNFPTAGHLWRFAGLDPTMQWLDKDSIKNILDSTLPSGYKSSDVLSREDLERIGLAVPGKKKAKAIINSIRFLKKEFDKVSSEDLSLFLTEVADKEAADIACGLYNESGSNVAEKLQDVASNLGITIDNLYTDVQGWKKENTHHDEVTVAWVKKGLSLRPWNARLKVLCYKISDSFMKMGGYYRELYDKRRAYEEDKNSRREYAEQATLRVATCNNAEHKKIYKDGRLPDGHICARVNRWVVKIFLSHYHEKGYTLAGKTPPKPFALAHLGHAHYYPVPENDNEKFKAQKAKAKKKKELQEALA